jgi:hypothetical protein
MTPLIKVCARKSVSDFRAFFEATRDISNRSHKVALELKKGQLFLARAGEFECKHAR